MGMGKSAEECSAKGVKMVGQTKQKPHIRLIQGVQPPLWVCKGQGRWNGHGESPQAAYRDWGGRRIDLARCAGVGQRNMGPGQEVALDAWQVCKRRMVVALVAATVLWLLWV